METGWFTFIGWATAERYWRDGDRNPRCPMRNLPDMARSSSIMTNDNQRVDGFRLIFPIIPTQTDAKGAG